MCDEDVSAKQMSQVKQHRATKKHTVPVKRKNNGEKSGNHSLLTTMHETTHRNRNASELSMDLSRCFLDANIPLHEIAHPALFKFVEKHKTLKTNWPPLNATLHAFPP